MSLPEKISYDSYCYMLNRCAYWLISNNKSFKMRNTYNYFGRTADQGTIIKAIKDRGTKYQSDSLIAEFVECAIVDNSTNRDKWMPNYCTDKEGDQIPRAKVCDMAVRTSAFEVKNGRSPNHVNLGDAVEKTTSSSSSSSTSNCKSPYSQSPVLTKQAPGYLGQKTSYNCGPHSLMQAIYNLTGINMSESTLASWCGTTTSGTGHAGLNTGIAKFNSKYGENLKIQWKNMSDFGSTTAEQFKNICKLTCEGKFVFFHLLYRNKYGHYEAFKSFNSSSNSFQILNSLGNKSGSGYYGYIETRSGSNQKSYISGISQPSVAILSKG